MHRRREAVEGCRKPTVAEERNEKQSRDRGSCRGISISRESGSLALSLQIEWAQEGERPARSTLSRSLLTFATMPDSRKKTLFFPVLCLEEEGAEKGELLVAGEDSQPSPQSSLHHDIGEEKSCSKARQDSG